LRFVIAENPQIRSWTETKGQQRFCNPVGGGNQFQPAIAAVFLRAWSPVTKYLTCAITVSSVAHHMNQVFFHLPVRY
ncbi:MAG: hypothetical protein WCI48_16060, partial [Bacteroidota bacterium]